MAKVEMAAIPFGAHQASRHMAVREVAHLVDVLDKAGRVADLS